jgi:orotate phosphoribosyltransferase
MRVQLLGDTLPDVMLQGLREGAAEARMKEPLDAIKDSGAIMTGHFEFGELHGSMYVNPRRLFTAPHLGKSLAQGLADAIPSKVKEKIDLVVAPNSCGIIVGRDLADALTTARAVRNEKKEFIAWKMRYIPALFLHREEVHRRWWQLGQQRKKKVYRFLPSDRRFLEHFTVRYEVNVLLVDDVRHRGETFELCRTEVETTGAKVVATAELVDRAFLGETEGNYYVAQTDPDQLYPKNQCPMCARGIPITTF